MVCFPKGIQPKALRSLHVGSALAAEPNDFEDGLFPLLLGFHVLHNHCD